MNAAEFQNRLLAWFDQHGRKHLPWQTDRSAYRVWVSEIMLQQTQVNTVIPYFLKFIDRFPDVASLATAKADDVIALWAGLGYYARARNLHRAAQVIMERHNGMVPGNFDSLHALPGIGRSTAGAIMSLSMNMRAAILDGNVRRVLCRFMGITGWPGDAVINRQLWSIAESLTPTGRVAEFNQGMMDLGAMVCRRNQPDCIACPLSSGCLARASGQQNMLPTPRPRLTIPVKTCFMLILIRSGQQVLLESRPPTGIWGGLRSLPEFETLDDLTCWCARYGVYPDSLQPMKRRRHTFSHYHLDFVPILGHAPEADSIHEEGAYGWFTPAAASGLPAPIAKLLAELKLP